MFVQEWMEYGYHDVPKFYVHCITIYGHSWPFIGSNTQAHAILHTRRAVVADPGPSRRPHRLEPAAFLGRGLRGGTWGWPNERTPHTDVENPLFVDHFEG